MDKSLLARCDGEGGCGKEFRITKLELDKLNRGIEKTYFRCPHCNKEYVAFYTDRNIRRKQAKIRTLTDLEAISKLKQEIGRDMDELKTKVEKRIVY